MEKKRFVIVLLVALILFNLALSCWMIYSQQNYQVSCVAVGKEAWPGGASTMWYSFKQQYQLVCRGE